MTVQVTRPERQVDRTRARRVVAVAFAVGAAIFAVLGVMDMLDSPLPAPIEFPAVLP